MQQKRNIGSYEEEKGPKEAPPSFARRRSSDRPALRSTEEASFNLAVETP